MTKRDRSKLPFDNIASMKRKIDEMVWDFYMGIFRNTLKLNACLSDRERNTDFRKRREVIEKKRRELQNGRKE